MNHYSGISGGVEETVFARMLRAPQVFVIPVFQEEESVSEQVSMLSRGFTEACGGHLQEVLGQLTGRQCFLMVGSEGHPAADENIQLDETDLAWYINVAASSEHRISWVISLYDRESEIMLFASQRVKETGRLSFQGAELLEEIYESTLEILELPCCQGDPVL